MEGKEGLVLMDQHAAHERVNFENFRRAIESGGVPCQRLLLPVTLQTTPRDADLLRQNLPSLNRLGIEIEPFGPNIFKVETLPSFLKTDDPAAWLDQVIEELEQPEYQILQPAPERRRHRHHRLPRLGEEQRCSSSPSPRCRRC